MTPPRPGLATAAFLHAHGIDVRPDTLAALLEEAVERLACSLYPPHPRDDLTEGEAAALERGGFDLEPRAQGRDDPLVRSAAEYGALLRASLTTSEAAERLGVDSSRIRQRLGASPPTLYGIRSRSGWRLPAFQFHGDGLVPGVGPVLAGLDAELHPVAVQR